MLARREVDRLPRHDAYWEDTLALWRTQGLGDADPLDLFEMDFDTMYLDLSPRFQQKVLAEDSQLITAQDRAGYVVRKFAGKSRSMEFLDHLTKDRATWERHRARLTLDPDANGEARLDDRSYFMHLDCYPSWSEAKSKYDALKRRNRFLLFCAYGPWEATWRHRGIDTLLMDLALDPEWVREMAGAHTSLLLETLAHCFSVGAKPDGLFLVDDFGCTRGLLFSPSMWCDIFQPLYRQLSEFLHGVGVSFWLHSCGDVRILIPHLIDAGLDVLQPLQASANMDLLELLPEYADRLVLFGNISAAAMSGPSDKLERELADKLSLGRHYGSYIYHSDHSVPPEVSWQRYRHLMARVERHSRI